MGKTPNSGTGNVPGDHNEPSGLLLLYSMADTTWRMFVPTLPLIILGNYLDERLNTKPWLLLLGALVGGALAALLIRAQLRKKYDK